MATKSLKRDPSSQTCCTNCIQKCNLCPTIFHRVFEKVFGGVGKTVATYPWPTIVICIIVVASCSVGFTFFKSENRIEKLYVPPRSLSIRNLEEADDFFPLINTRVESIIFVPRSGNSITSRQCLLEVLQLHYNITSLVDYETLCIKNTITGSQDCVYLNPMEIFKFNEKNVYNISKTFETAYHSPGLLMANGRPFSMNFGLMFSNPRWVNNTLQTPKALRVQYYMSDKEKDFEAVIEWEKTFIDIVSKQKTSLSCADLYYQAGRSLADATEESSGSDIVLLSITFTLMISFTCTVLGKFRNPLTGHSLLANIGILSVGLGVVAGLGLPLFWGVPFISIVGLLPFLILGIGIDDVFVIIDQLDRIDYTNMDVVTTVKFVMSHTGATITMTTITDLVAFAVSTSTQFPSIKYFCTYAALTITFAYLVIITFFVAFLSFDVRRIKARRRDCLPFCSGTPKEERPEALSSKFMREWAKLLMAPAARTVVVIFSLALLGVSVFYSLKISEDFDRRLLAKKGAQIIDFLNMEDRHFESVIPVRLIVTTKINYEDIDIQQQILNLPKIVTTNTYYQNRTLSWMESLRSFANLNGINITGSGFMPTLKIFLGIPDYAQFRQDIVFSADNSTILASCVLRCFTKPTTSSIVQKDAMLTLRNDLSSGTNLPVSPTAKAFIYLEQYAITKSEITRNLIVAGITVFVIVLPFLLSFTATFIIFLGFGALIFELFALMYLWDVSLNMISAINLVMAIGFSVDYSAHVAHAYVLSTHERPEDRAIYALSTIGASVLMGGTSTFLGIIVTAFASSQIFVIFFKMFLGIIVLGLLHGLCILPVYLSLLCRWAPTKDKDKDIVDASTSRKVGNENEAYEQHERATSENL